MANENEGKSFDTTTGTWIDAPAKTDPPEIKTEPPAAAAGEPPAKKEDTKTEPAPTTPDFASHLASKYKDKYGIENEQDLEEILSINEDLITELEETRKSSLKFDSEQDRLAFEFIKNHPPSLLGEGLHTYSNLIKMGDVDKINGKDAMREAFILSKPNLTREKASRLFEADYQRHTLKRDDFESDDSFKEAQELADIRREEEEDRARKTLLQKKEELKPKEQAKKKEEEAPKVPEESFREYSGHVDKFFKDFQSFDFYEKEGDKEPLYSVKPTPEMLATVKDAISKHLQKADLYDKSGKIPNFDPADLAWQLTTLMFDKDGNVNTKGPRWLMTQMNSQIKTLASKLKIEQIADKQPDKKGDGGKGEDGPMSFTDQFLELGKKAVSDREKAGIRQVQ